MPREYLSVLSLIYLEVEKRFGEIVESLVMSVLNFFGEIIPILVLADRRPHLYRRNGSGLSSLQNKRHCQQIYHVGYTSSYLNTLVKQHWAWIILGCETLQGILGSAAPPPCGQSIVLLGCFCLNQVIETRPALTK